MRAVKVYEVKELAPDIASEIERFWSFPEFERFYLVNEEEIEKKEDDWKREISRVWYNDKEEYQRQFSRMYSVISYLERMLEEIEGDEFIFQFS